MPKIVYAPILEQAGFLKRKAAVVVEQWVAQLDGALQHWSFSELVRPARTFTIKFKVKQSQTSGIRVFIGDDLGGSTRFYIGSDQGQLLIGNGADRSIVSGVSITDSFKQITWEVSDDYFKVYVDNVIAYSSINNNPRDVSFGSLSQPGSYKVEGVIYDFLLYSGAGNEKVLTNAIPLTKKAQGATQLATVGNVNAFMPNYTEAVWRKP